MTEIMYTHTFNWQRQKISVCIIVFSIFGFKAAKSDPSLQCYSGPSALSTIDIVSKCTGHCIKFTDTHDHVTYGCDEKYMCDKKLEDQLLHKISMNNTVGDLYCCAKSLCNKPSSPETLPNIKSQQKTLTVIEDKSHLKCYHTIDRNNDEVQVVDDEVICDEHCLYKAEATYKVVPAVEGQTNVSSIEPVYTKPMLGCDSEELCKHNSHNPCRLVSHNSTIVHMICCCSTSLCNNRSLPYHIQDTMTYDSREIHNASDGERYIQSAIGHDFMRSGSLSWMFLGGMGLAVIVLVCIVLGIVSVCRCAKRNRYVLSHVQ